jgi:hypothetical protein
MGEASWFQDGLGELHIHLVEPGMVDRIRFEGCQTGLVFWRQPYE